MNEGLDLNYLVYIAKDLPSNVFATRLFMVKDTGGSRLEHILLAFLMI